MLGGPAAAAVAARAVLVLALELDGAADGVSGRVGLFAFGCFVGLSEGRLVIPGVDEGVAMGAVAID